MQFSSKKSERNVPVVCKRNVQVCISNSPVINNSKRKCYSVQVR